MKRVAVCLFLLLILLPLGGMAENYVSIQDLYQETRTPWQAAYPLADSEKYATLLADYVFSVDLIPSVPDVERFPVLRLKARPFTPTDLDMSVFIESSIPIFQQSEAISRSLGRATLIMGGVNPVNPLGDFGRRPYDEADVAQNNPLSPDDAAALAMELWQRYMRVDNVRVRGVIGYGCEPLYAPTNDAKHRRDLTLDRGGYTVVGEQVFAGIPLLNACECYEEYREFSAVYPSVCWQVDLMDEKHFILNGSVMEQIGTEYEDVPLLPFSRIREIYEAYLRASSDKRPLIDLLSAELGYRLAPPPGEPMNRLADNEYITQPVWILRGYFAMPLFGSESDRRDIVAQEEITRAHSRQMALGLAFERSYLCIDAQTGEIVEHYLLDAPQIVTWP